MENMFIVIYCTVCKHTCTISANSWNENKFSLIIRNCSGKLTCTVQYFFLKSTCALAKFVNRLARDDSGEN